MEIKRILINGGCWASIFDTTCKVRKDSVQIIPFTGPIAGFRIILK